MIAKQKELLFMKTAKPTSLRPKIQPVLFTKNSETQYVVNLLGDVALRKNP